jgi:hypothetical protein
MVSTGCINKTSKLALFASFDVFIKCIIQLKNESNPSPFA